MKASLLFLLFFIPVSHAQGIFGEWHTSFVVMGISNRLDMQISGSLSAPEVYVSDPDAKKKTTVKMDNVALTDSTLSFQWTNIGLRFQGSYYSTGDSIQGYMSQSDVRWGAVFRREQGELIKIRRPQEPHPPFAYPVEELTIKNGDITLGATLTLPKNISGPYPIVVLASGSGPQDRDCELLGHKSFLVIADYLARNGIGCLRFDDRGTGTSTGKFSDATLEDFASDVKACIQYIHKDPRFKGYPIGIAGHSEGGMHALMAARKNKKVSFVIALASVGTSGREVLVEQQYLIPLKNGKSQEYAEWNKAVFAGLCDLITIYPKDKAVDPIGIFLDSMYAIAPDDYRTENNLFNFKLGMLMFMNNQWAREFVAFEARDYLKRIKVPILSINGSLDIQVPPYSNQSGFEKGFSKHSSIRSNAIIVEGLNHLFQHCTTCTVFEYGDLEETFSNEVLDIIRDWIRSLPNN